jgi:hypothetical protein
MDLGLPGQVTTNPSKSVRVDGRKETYCRNHLEQLQRFGSPATGSGFSAFQLGTGWFPTVPIGFFLCVAREVWIWDIVPFLRRDRL